MMASRLIVLAALAASLLLTACGQRGPLYLPDPNAKEAPQLDPVAPKRRPDLRK